MDVQIREVEVAVERPVCEHPQVDERALTVHDGRSSRPWLGQSLIGAEAAKPCIPIILPLGPTYCDQPKVAAASTDTLAFAGGGRTCSCNRHFAFRRCPTMAC